MSATGGASNPVAELPFEILLWIAGADHNVEAEEVEIFQRMLEHRSWCKSRLAQAVLPRAQAEWPRLWQAFARKQRDRDLARIGQGLQAAVAAAAADDVEPFKQDMMRLAESIARATGGFLGLGSISFEEQRALRELSALSASVIGGQRPPAADPRVAPASPGLIAPSSLPAPAAASGGEGPAGPPRWTQGRIRLRCVETVAETHDVRTFRWVAEPPMLFDYQPGQFLTLDLEIDGNQVKRSYSISSSPTRPAALEITVKRVPGGLVSNWLHDHVRPGFAVWASGPSGKFTCLPRPPEKLLLLSAGSGVTPVISMSRWLFDSGAQSDVVFLHSARTLDDVPFLAELAFMAARSRRFRSSLVLTRPPPEQQWNGPTGRITPALVLREVPDYRSRTIYSCGPTPFMETAREVMTQLGFPMERFHLESFGGAKAGERGAKRPASSSMADLLPTPTTVPRLQPAARRQPTAEMPRVTAPRLAKVVFARSGREVAHDGETPLLELAERMGVSIPNACRAGVCGTCKVTVREGEVSMSCTDGLGPGEQAQGKVLSCIGLPRGAVVVEY